MAGTTKVFVNNNPPACEDDDLNGYKNENNILITSSGQSLNTSDNDQTSKAVANYAAKGDFYQEAGGSAADVYVLEESDIQKQLTQYKDGMRIRFRVVNANTSASTININSIGVKNIKKGLENLTLGDIVVDDIVTLIYDESNDEFQLYNPKQIDWQIKFLSADVISDVVISDLTYTLTVGATYRITLKMNSRVTAADNDVAIDIKDGATVIGRLSGDNNFTADMFNSSIIIRKMVNTALTFVAASATANALIAGNGAGDETYVMIEKLPNHNETTVT